VTTPLDRVETALATLGRDHEPPPGWEARVLAAIEARPPWWHRWRRWLAIPAVAVVALAMLQLRAPAGLELAVEITPTEQVVRGSSAHLGDLVAATASGGGRYRAIWVYRDDDLIAVCPGAALCEITGARSRATIALAALGEYEFVALSSARPIPPARGSYDLDMASAADAGVTSQAHRISVK
jgi:hypothetical protein